MTRSRSVVLGSSLVVMVGVQMVAVQLLPEVAAAAVQEETKVGPVVIGVGQVKVV